MKRALSVLAVVLASWSAHASAASWAESLFSELRRDFGSIPRGAEARHTFTLTNSTANPIQISGMERTCVCIQFVTLDDKVVLDPNTRKSREKRVVNPGDQVRIGILFDSRSFLNGKSGEIIVSFNEPNNAEVRLTVSAFVRQDIVLNPGSIQFGSLSAKQEATKDVEIEYAGEADWQILGVTSENPSLEVKYDELYRKSGRVGYRLSVHHKPAAATGTIRDVLVVETNDPATRHFPVLVAGQVQPDLIVTPTNLSFGAVKPNQTVTRQVLVRGKQPFRLMKVNGGDARFQFEASDSAQTLHKVTVRFAASEPLGALDSTFRIETDLEDEPFVEVKVSANLTQ